MTGTRWNLRGEGNLGGEQRTWQRQPILTEVVLNGELAEVARRVLPQVVPAALCQAAGDSMVSLPLAEGVRVALVLDQPKRYMYISHATMQRWRVRESTLLALALRNLRELSSDQEWKRIGTCSREMMLCETFDGYDASRVLLLGDQEHLFSHLPGDLIVAMPHRDYLVVTSDAEPSHVAWLMATVASDFREARYPISPWLFRFAGGNLHPYPGPKVAPEQH